jgi:hypothetical protein
MEIKNHSPLTHWMTRKQLMEYLGGVNVKTVMRYERIGMPAYRVRGTAYYDRAEIDEWIRERKFNPTGIRAPFLRDSGHTTP